VDNPQPAADPLKNVELLSRKIRPPQERVVFEDRNRVRLELVLDDPSNPDAIIRVRIDGGGTAEPFKRLIESA
jgi:hypothetical protein